MFKPTIAQIQKDVCAIYNVRLDHLLSDRQDRKIVEPRHVAMAVAAHSTLHSLPTIGRLFRRDHTTVVHAMRKIAVEKHEIAGELVRKYNQPKTKRQSGNRWPQERLEFVRELVEGGMTWREATNALNERFDLVFTAGGVHNALQRAGMHTPKTRTFYKGKPTKSRESASPEDANHVTLGGQRRCCNTDEALTETTLSSGASNG
jgi:hypothetical protein